MAIIHPFKGWLPKPEKADEVASVPYDVISTEEADEMAKDKPFSFLHVIRPEIDLPEGTAFNDESVYEKGAENLKNLLRSDLYEQDSKSAIYIYQLETDDHTQTGVFTCASVEDYDNDVILKHELTRPDKEDDRTRHILTQEAHAEPVMLTFKDTEDIAFHIQKVTMTSEPFIEHTGDDGVTHKIWKSFSTVDFVKGFSNIENLYIADGHHRCKSASRVAEMLRNKRKTFPGESEFEYFPVVLFPMDQMRILPYNRVLKNVSDETFDKLVEKFGAEKTTSKEPEQKGVINLYYKGDWWEMNLPEAKDDKVASSLDAAILQDQILNPFFNIENPRTDKKINFVGGIRGTKELEKVVDSGKYDLAISMYPTSIQELVDVSDQGELMPPKSTWFEPKLKSGLIIHTF
ncbi:DUF1015 domain-containing protein [Rhodohalobacter sulfatireducens]|uniref:DUF1015 family protein n=1 Tax=Rhodohalobacter sulfatireducens TaxID=2911366 RepID=A0ABS9KEV4_9BACT|nr:DUF1015 family protein [Rhodohalobacter sulfatireducens]MCG2589377.1 DUF1015 family protein [Rhodohalobacter sulfatireducens]